MQSSRGSDVNEHRAGAPVSEPESREPARDVATLEADLARMEDRYKRALADLDNYRKRTERDFEARVAESKGALLRDWLEVVDSVERAVRLGVEDSGFEGMRALLDQMEAMLARHGVTRVGAAGEQFDPERHQAIDMRMTDEVPDLTIVDVARSGFAQGDRVLRPAHVVVARTPERAR
jgi:molecular chaperone GrpE